MKKRLLTLLLLVGLLRILQAQQQPEWQNQYAIGLNKTEPHTYVWPYAGEQAVIAREHETSPWFQLRRNGNITVHLDAAQNGVGTATCGPGVRPEYLVKVAECTFDFIFEFIPTDNK